MAIQSLGLVFELQILPRYAGGNSVISGPMASGGFAHSTSCKLSNRPISTNSLSVAFAAKCTLAPTTNVPGAVEHSFLASFMPSSVPVIASQEGQRCRAYHGHLSVGKRNIRQLRLLTPSPPSLEGGMGSSFRCALALPMSRFRFQGQRVRSVLYRIWKRSTPFSLSWSRKKRRYGNLRVSETSASGVRCVPMHYRWLSTLHRYSVRTSSPVSSLGSDYIIARTLYRGFRGFQASSDGIGHFSTVRSLRSRAEGHGFPEKVMLAEEEKPDEEQMWPSGERKRDFLAVGYGWRVRDAGLNDLQELRRVADIQTDAFHIPAAAFDDLFYKLFHAEVLSSLQYKARHSPPDRYSCLLAEKDPSQPGYIEDMLDDENEQTVVGAVDVTALMDSNIVSLLPGAYEYLYISGMAVDARYRRRSVATLLLEASVSRASEWGFKYLVLHAYEDDVGARNLYSRAGFRTVGGDPLWMTKFLRRRRRVVMARSTVQVSDEVP